MKITYNNTKEDLKPFLIHERINSVEYAKETASTKRMYTFMAVAMAAYGGFLIYRYFIVLKQDPQQVQTLSNGISILLSSILIFLMRLIVKPIKKSFVNWEIKGDLKKMSDDPSGPVNVEITDSLISWKMGNKSGSQKQTEKYEVIETPQSYYVYLKKETLLIPKRIFAEYDQQEFRKLLRVEKKK